MNIESRQLPAAPGARVLIVALCMLSGCTPQETSDIPGSLTNAVVTNTDPASKDAPDESAVASTDDGLSAAAAEPEPTKVTLVSEPVAAAENEEVAGGDSDTTSQRRELLFEGWPEPK